MNTRPLGCIEGLVWFGDLNEANNGLANQGFLYFNYSIEQNVHNLRNKILSHELGSSLQCACLDSGARGCSGILISISGILIEQRVYIEANETTDLAIAALESCESTRETKN